MQAEHSKAQEMGSPDGTKSGQIRLQHEHTNGHGAHYSLPQVCSGFLYAFISVTITFANKAVLVTYGYKFSNVMMVMQMLFTIAFLELLKSARVITYPRFEWATAKKVLPVAVFYCLNVAFALASLRALNVPMYNVLKRLTTFVVMIQEAVLLRKSFSPKTKLAVSIIVLGAILAGVSDVDFDLFSYSLAIGSCCVQSLYLIAVNRAGVEGDLNTFGLLFYNSVLSIPCLLLVLLATGEWRAAAAYPHYFEWDFQLVMGINLLMGTALNYALFWCTQINSALTTTIIGQLKVILSTAIGFFVFSSKSVSALNLAGVLLNTAGGLYYARVKWDEKSRKPLLPVKG